MDCTCPYQTCHKVFSSRYNLNTHVKVHHLQVKRFPCPLCGRCFGYKHTMRKHQATHRAGRRSREELLGELIKVGLVALGKLLAK